MAPDLDSPIQARMTVTVLNRAHSSACDGGTRCDGKPVGRRRVFVQTEAGCVLGMELDRGDNVHTVKKRLQVAFNVPTDESLLTFGDLVLENDLSAIRKDSPLLLTRNMVHRSSSTPCFSLAGKDADQKDVSGPIEILGCSSRWFEMKHIIEEVVNGIKNSVHPVPVQSGLGGAYYFRNSKGESVAILKPTDEEPFAPNNPKGFVGKALGQPGLKKTVRVGETGFREVAAYLLDYDHFANVPPTILVKITHAIFHVNEGVNCNNAKVCDRKQMPVSKIASLQQFIRHDFDASDHGTSSFPTAAIHRIGILDIRIFNTDRHAGNLLVRKMDGGAGKFGGQMELIPIDHGLSLPESLEDPYFEWIHWPQASVPFSDEELEYIAKLDPVRDSDMLRRELPMIREACLRVLVLCTIFLKEAAAFGLCLSEIGEMMSREFRGQKEAPSELEVVCMEARNLAEERDVCPSEDEPAAEDLFQLDIDKGENGFSVHDVPPSYHFRLGLQVSTNLLSRLEETLEEEEEKGEKEDEKSGLKQVTSFQQLHEQFPDTSKFSVSLKGASHTEKAKQYQVGASKRDEIISETLNDGVGLPDRNINSANGQLPGSASFVSFADIREEEWLTFPEKFQELLPSAFRGRKFRAAEQRQWQRLGTSCKF